MRHFRDNSPPDFEDFRLPEWDFSSLNLNQVDQAKLLEACKKDFKASMSTLDSSVGAAAASYIGNRADSQEGELMKWVKDLNQRYLDLYEAYAEIQAENNDYLIPRQAGFLKQYGYGHEEIIDLIQYAKDYDKPGFNIFKKMIARFHLTELQSRLYLIGKDDDFYQLVNQISRIHLRRSQDFKERLYQEITDRVIGSDLAAVENSGSVGNSVLSILKVLKGKEEALSDPIAVFRTRMYFLYASNNLANDIIRHPKLAQKINKKLQEKGRSWNLDTQLIRMLNHNNSTNFFNSPYARMAFSRKIFNSRKAI